MKKITLLFMLFISAITFAQDDAVDSDVRPYRVSLKFGVPNLASLEFEYLTPLLNHRVAPFANFTSASYKQDDVNAGLTIFEVGSNIYFSRNNEGRGLYGSLSYQYIGANLKIEEYQPDIVGSPITYEGTSTASVKLNGVNVKVGAKLGRKFFFRTELGYSFGSTPKEIVIDGTYQGQKVKDVRNIEKDIEDVPVISMGGLPIFNLGFGYAF